MLTVNFVHTAGETVYIIIATTDLDTAWNPTSYRFSNVLDADDVPVSTDTFAIDLTEDTYYPGVYSAEVPFDADSDEYIIHVYSTDGTGPNVTYDTNVGTYALYYNGTKEITILDLYNKVETGAGLTALEKRMLREIYQRKNNNRTSK